MTRDESRAQTIQRVLDSAEKLFEARGFSKVSVAEIAESAGYSTGAVYANFPNKEALFLEVSKRRRSQEDDSLGRIVRAARTPAELLNGIGRWHVDLRREHAAQILVSGEFWLMQGRNPQLREKARRGYSWPFGFPMVIIDELDRLGISPPKHPDHPWQLVRMIMALRTGIESQCWFDPANADDEVFPRGVALILGLDPDLVCLGGPGDTGDVPAEPALAEEVLFGQEG